MSKPSYRKSFEDAIRLWAGFPPKDADPDFTPREHKGENVIPQDINAHFDPTKHHVNLVPVKTVVNIKPVLEPLSYGISTPMKRTLTAQAGNDQLANRLMNIRQRTQESKEYIHTRQLQMAAACDMPLMAPLFLFMTDHEVDGLLEICKSLAGDNDAPVHD